MIHPIVIGTGADIVSAMGSATVLNGSHHAATMIIDDDLDTPIATATIYFEIVNTYKKIVEELKNVLNVIIFFIFIIKLIHDQVMAVTFRRKSLSGYG